jgi:predicted amidophosphoribosyltransferase
MENFGEIFTIMTSEKLNKMCIDCKKPYPLYASINNGIFLCDSCASHHRTYGTEISYVRYLKDPWDEYLLSYMYRGGNKRFLSCLEEFNIPDEIDASQKYFTNGVDNYRKIVTKNLA